MKQGNKVPHKPRKKRSNMGENAKDVDWQTNQLVGSGEQGEKKKGKRQTMGTNTTGTR